MIIIRNSSDLNSRSFATALLELLSAATGALSFLKSTRRQILCSSLPKPKAIEGWIPFSSSISGGWALERIDESGSFSDMMVMESAHIGYLNNFTFVRRVNGTVIWAI